MFSHRHIVALLLKLAAEPPKIHPVSMGRTIKEQSKGRTRYVFQIDSDSDGSVIRVVDSHSGAVLREIPIAQFVAYAKKNKDVKAFLLGRVS